MSAVLPSLRCCSMALTRSARRAFSARPPLLMEPPLAGLKVVDLTRVLGRPLWPLRAVRI